MLLGGLCGESCRVPGGIFFHRSEMITGQEINRYSAGENGIADHHSPDVMEGFIENSRSPEMAGE